MKIDFQAFVDTLPIMGKGMAGAGIFIVTAVIILAMIALRELTKSKK